MHPSHFALKSSSNHSHLSLLACFAPLVPELVPAPLIQTRLGFCWAETNTNLILYHISTWDGHIVWWEYHYDLAVICHEYCKNRQACLLFRLSSLIFMQTEKYEFFNLWQICKFISLTGRLNDILISLTGRLNDILISCKYNYCDMLGASQKPSKHIIFHYVMVMFLI